MSTMRQCEAGHSWNSATSKACPWCAAESAVPDTSQPFPDTILGDELPPPPTSQSAAVATQVASPPLRTVAGFELLNEVGRGGMGIVYRARQLSLNRIVALKMILAGEHASQRDLVRFQAEAETAARLQHANIVQVHEVGTWLDATSGSSAPYLVMEFVEGGSLAEQLGGKPQAALPAAQLVETLARAVQFAHERGVIHRDLKPGNVLLSGEPAALAAGCGTAKITDFGLARRTDTAGDTTTGAILGTPSYMAPEQAVGLAKHVGPAADVYSLGAILYELLTGRPPFRSSSALATLQQVLHEEVLSPVRLQADVPRDLETICLKCLQKEPRKRYASALILADDLARFQRGEPILARPVGRFGRAWRWCKRRPGTAALLAAVVILLLASTFASIAFAVVSMLRAEEEREHAEMAALLTIREREAAMKAVEAREEAVRTLIDGVLLPLGRTADEPPADEEALWKIASLTDDRLKLQCLETGLKNSRAAARLALTADTFVQALVGLDESRRRDTAVLLHRRLQEKDLDAQTRNACILLSAALTDVEPDHAALAIRLLREDLLQFKTFLSTTEAIRAIGVLATRLSPDDATTTARFLAGALAEPWPTRQLALTTVLLPRVDQLPAPEAAKAHELVAQLLTESLQRGTHRDTPDQYRAPLLAFAKHAPTPEAQRVARAVVAVMKSDDFFATMTVALDDCLPPLLARCELLEAAQLAGQANTAFRAILAKTLTYSPAGAVRQARAVQAIALSSSPGEQARLRAGLVVDLLGAVESKPADTFEKDLLGEYLGRQLGLLDPAAAEKAADQLLAAARKPNSLPATLSAVALALGPHPQLLKEQAAAELLAILRERIKAIRIRLLDQSQQSSAGVMLGYLNTGASLAVASAALADRLPEADLHEAQALLHSLLEPRVLRRDMLLAAAITRAFLLLAPRLAETERARLSLRLAHRLFLDLERRRHRAQEWQLRNTRDAFRQSLPQLATSDLVNMLKAPLCRADVAALLLDELGRRSARTFATTWDYVRWAKDNQPNLDLANPPDRLLD